MALSTFRTNLVVLAAAHPGGGHGSHPGVLPLVQLAGAGQSHGVVGACRRCYGSIIQRCAGGDGEQGANVSR